MTIPSLLWLLPVVFMIHDFEEIIMMKPWLRQNAGVLQSRLPSFASHILSHSEKLSTSGFALAVAEEFVVLSALTWMAVENKLYNLWAGILIAFGLHLVVHIVQFVILRRYVPVLITTVPGLAFCAYALTNLKNGGYLIGSQTALWAGCALLILVANLTFALWLAQRFDAWLERRFAS